MLAVEVPGNSRRISKAPKGTCSPSLILKGRRERLRNGEEGLVGKRNKEGRSLGDIPMRAPQKDYYRCLFFFFSCPCSMVELGIGGLS